MNASGRKTQRSRKELHVRNPRFRQLLALAQEGDQDAIGDLFREFNFDFEKEGGRYE